jgi:SAM-dependent methyltransferase
MTAAHVFDEPQRSRPCAVCGSTQAALLYRARFARIAGVSVLDGYDLVSCDRCGFCFGAGVPTQAALDDYYRDATKYSTGGGPEPEADRARFAMQAAAIQRALPARDARVLELGCAEGGLLMRLRTLGYRDLHGVERAPQCVQTAVARGLDVRCDSLFGTSDGSPRYDVVIINGVAEHVVDLHQALARVAELLVEGGAVAIEVPDASEFGRTLQFPLQQLSVEHVNFFSLAGLSNLLTTHGFVPFAHWRADEPLGSGSVDPVVGVAARFQPAHLGSYVRDPDCAQALRGYVSASMDALQPCFELAESLAVAGQPIVVWGTGTLLLRLRASSALARVKVLAFIDSNPRYHGHRIDGVPILPPETLRSFDANVLIASMGFQREIERQIRDQLDCTNPIMFLHPLAPCVSTERTREGGLQPT